MNNNTTSLMSELLALMKEQLDEIHDSPVRPALVSMGIMNGLFVLVTNCLLIAGLIATKPQRQKLR